MEPRTSSLGVLLYTRNDGDGVLRHLETLRSIADEIVVVDSSAPENRARLAAELQAPRERVIAAPPLGNVDLLRPFGVSRMTSDRVLLLDSDEEISEPLRRRVRDLDGADAYVLPRWETGLRGFTHHMRLVRRTRIRFFGPSCGFPQVLGTTQVLPRPLHLVHHVPSGREFWSSRDRERRYLLSDLLERPFDGDFLARQLHVWPRPGPIGPASARAASARESSPPARWFGLVVDGARALLTTQSAGLVRLRIEEGLRRIRSWESLSDSERSWYLATSSDVRSAGGLARYLGLDDPAYVERLNSAFDGTADGPGVLRFLVESRSRDGRPWEAVAQPAPSFPADELEGRGTR